MFCDEVCDEVCVVTESEPNSYDHWVRDGLLCCPSSHQCASRFCNATGIPLHVERAECCGLMSMRDWTRLRGLVHRELHRICGLLQWLNAAPPSVHLQSLGSDRYLGSRRYLNTEIDVLDRTTLMKRNFQLVQVREHQYPKKAVLAYR